MDDAVTCKFCKKCRDTAANLQAAHYQVCPSCPVQCPNLCGAKPMRKNLQKHQDVCSVKGNKELKPHSSEATEIIQCPNDCGAAMPQAQISEHRLLCPKELFPCRYECTQFVLREELSLHYKQCPNVKVVCPDCSVVVLRSELSAHKTSCSKITISCSNGCSILREDLSTHSTVCPKEIVACPDGCKNYIMRKNLLEHQSDCPKVKVYCLNGCGSKLLRKNLSNHEQKCSAMVYCLNGCKVLKKELDIHYFECPKAVIQCPNGCQVKREDLPTHNAECPKAIIQCPNGCQVIKEELPTHNAECPRAVVNCPNGCTLLRMDLDAHNLQCPNKPIICRNGCKAIITKKILLEHQHDCPKVKICCPNGCGVNLFQKNFSKHKLKCKKAVVACPNGCEVLREELSKHNTECPKTVVACPNGCCCKVLRKELSTHNAECPKEVVDCPNGCKVLRMDLDVHISQCFDDDLIVCLNGCKATFMKKMLSQHQHVCPKAKILCPNGCRISFQRKNIKKHESKCKAMVYCSNGCRVSKLELTNHNSICPKALVECPTCKISFSRERLIDHLCPKELIVCYCKVSMLRENQALHLLTCPKAVVCCPNGCSVLREDFLSHSIDCPEQYIDCPECTSWIRRKNVSKHRCPKAIIKCPDGCDAVLIREKLSMHWCPKAIISCPNGCEELVMREKLLNHYYNDCPEVIVSCSTGCNALVPRQNIQEHESICLKARISSTGHIRALVSTKMPGHYYYPEYPAEPTILRNNCRKHHYLKTKPDMLSHYNQYECLGAMVFCRGCRASISVNMIRHHYRQCPNVTVIPTCKTTVQQNTLAEHCRGIEWRDVIMRREDVQKHSRFYSEPDIILDCITPKNVQVITTEYLNQLLLDNSRHKYVYPCSMQCGAYLMKEDIDAHIAFSCPEVIKTCTYCDTSLKRRLVQRDHWDCRYRCSVRCPKGCSMHVMKEEIVEHLSGFCPNILIRCPEGCGTLLLRRNLNAHLEDSCPEYAVSCPSGCYALIKRGKVSQHLNNSCLLTQCPYRCGQSIITEGAAQHLDVCPEMMIACPAICGTRLKRKSMEEHLKYNCQFASYKKCCNYGCEKSIPKNEFPEHEKACRELCVVCPQGCGMRVVKKKLRQHLKKRCLHSNTDCPKHCGLRLQRSEVEKHLEEACPRASAVCVQGCEVTMLRRKIEKHVKTVCPLAIVHCPNNCGASMFRRNLPKHLGKMCPVVFTSTSSLPTVSSPSKSNIPISSISLVPEVISKSPVIIPSTSLVDPKSQVPVTSGYPVSVSAKSLDLTPESTVLDPPISLKAPCAKFPTMTSHLAELFGDDVTLSKHPKIRCFRCWQICVVPEEELVSNAPLYCDRCKIFSGSLENLKHMPPYCPYGCGAMPGKKNMFLHMEESCLLSPVTCVVRGCGVMVLRRDIVDHLLQCHGHLNVPCCYVVKKAFGEKCERDSLKSNWDEM